MRTPGTVLPKYLQLLERALRTVVAALACPPVNLDRGGIVVVRGPGNVDESAGMHFEMSTCRPPASCSSGSRS